MTMSNKSLAGQSQIVIPIFLIILTSAVALATNHTFNTTGLFVVDNESVPQLPELNTTLDVVPEELPSISEPSGPLQTVELDVNIEHPSKLTRGHGIVLKATVTNVGTLEAKNVVVNWQLPSGFESSSSSFSCGNLQPSETCVSEISVSTFLSAELGLNEVKVIVEYE